MAIFYVAKYAVFRSLNKQLFLGNEGEIFLCAFWFTDYTLCPFGGAIGTANRKGDRIAKNS